MHTHTHKQTKNRSNNNNNNNNNYNNNNKIEEYRNIPSDLYIFITIKHNHHTTYNLDNTLIWK